MTDADASDNASDNTHDAAPDQSSAPAPHWRETRARRAYLAATAREQQTTRRALLIGLVALLLLASIGAVTLTPRYFAAQRAASAFCAALQERDYAAAYALLDADARAGFSQQAYTTVMQALDTTMGQVSACDTGGLVGYHYLPGQTTASASVTLTRTRATLRGVVGLAFDGAGWRITSVAPSLYGMPLAPLATAAAFCAALRTGDYATAYALLGAAPPGTQVESDFVAAQRLRDTLTGHVTSCAVIGLAAPGAQTVNALLSVSRMTGPRQGGDLQIQTDGAAWRITQLDPAVLGVDVGPYLVGQQFCAAVASGDFGGAYALLGDALRAQTTLGQMRAALTPAPGYRWQCGPPQLGSYSVTGATASYSVTLISTVPDGAPGPQIATLQFTLIGGEWQISGY